MKEKLKKILIEVPTIVVSVMLALAVNEWNVDRERKNLAEKVVQTIKEELAFNIEQMQQAYTYHIPLVDNLAKKRHKVFSIPMKQLNLTMLSAEQLNKIMIEGLEREGNYIDQPLNVKKRNDSTFTMNFNKQILTIKIINDTLNIYGNGNINLRSAFIKNNAWRIAQTAQIAPHLDFTLISLMSEIELLHEAYQNNTNMILELLYKGEPNVTSAMQDMVHIESSLLKKYEKLQTLLNKE